jgi:hypothetical protein
LRIDRHAFVIMVNRLRGAALNVVPAIGIDGLVSGRVQVMS